MKRNRLLAQDKNQQAGKKQSADSSETMAWTGFCQSLFAASEFRYTN